jgi:hypothetical protein
VLATADAVIEWGTPWQMVCLLKGAGPNHVDAVGPFMTQFGTLGAKICCDAAGYRGQEPWQVASGNTDVAFRQQFQ